MNILPARMHLNKTSQVRKQLIHADARVLLRPPTQKPKVASRGFDAVGGLLVDRAQLLLDKLQVFRSEAARIGDALVRNLRETGYDRERPTDVMDDAAVNLVLRSQHLLLHSLTLDRK